MDMKEILRTYLCPVDKFKNLNGIVQFLKIQKVPNLPLMKGTTCIVLQLLKNGYHIFKFSKNKILTPQKHQKLKQKLSEPMLSEL